MKIILHCQSTLSLSFIVNFTILPGYNQLVNMYIECMLLVKFTDMASLLREQTRIKESLESALERQKEGM